MNIEILTQIVGVILLFVGCVTAGHAVSASVDNTEFPNRVEYFLLGLGILFAGVLFV